MNWTSRVKPIKIRRLYRFAKLGVYDELLIHDVGWQLYDRCCDIITVSDVYRFGIVPCPICRTQIKRSIDPLYSTGEGGTRESWFHCQHCHRRILWRDCRQALRNTPRCFSCHKVLSVSDELKCDCGQSWTKKSYSQSVRTRVRLPCPHCHNIVRRPEGPAREKTSTSQYHTPTLTCPKCEGRAFHRNGNIECIDCNYVRKWKAFRKSLKKKDEKLICEKCGCQFRWHEWRKSTETLRTGNPKPARDFVRRWLACRTSQQRMIQIDSLLQTLHGRGPLAPLFIDSGEYKIRQMLDELAS
ncbi:hypothetical protein JT359_07625 [Candidatus Poribacteria bacterium]|nr:hypothetical protein [Candidatus Poribacteria bacterium]